GRHTFSAPVTSCIAVRAKAHDTLGLSGRDSLREWADKLAWVASNTQSSISCTFVQTRDDEPCGNGRDDCEKHYCLRENECTDAIRETYEIFDQSKTLYSGSSCPEISRNAPDKAHTLMEQRYGGDEYAHLAAQWHEYATRANLALRQPAFQAPEPPPGTWWTAPASRAVDDNTDGNWYDGSVTHTDIAFQSWWAVDLGSLQHIRQIKIYNRTDCCSSRLSH